MTTSYTPAQPGTWLLLATAESVLFVDGVVAAAVDELWLALGGEGPVQSVLDILTRNGLGSAPAFALGHVATGTLHALVRGPLVLATNGAAGVDSVDGTGVSTWRETSIAGVTALSAGEHTGQLPIGSGVVWASGFAFQPGTAPIAADPLVAEVVAPVAVAAAVPPPPPPAPVAEPIAPMPVAVVAPVAAEPEPITVEPEPEPEPESAPEADLPAEHTMVEHTIVDHDDELPVPPPAPVTAAPPVENSSYSHLFEETVHRSIEEAAIREPEEDEDEATVVVVKAPPAAPLGDHDGETVMSADIAALRARKRAEAPAPAAPPARSVYLELPNNQREPLTQPVIIGRSPSVSQVSGTELPRLVSIPGSQDISRSHARFALEGDTVVVTDLHSRNGTTIALPGKPPQLLRKGEPTAVLPGTVVDLGGVVTLTVREG